MIRAVEVDRFAQRAFGAGKVANGDVCVRRDQPQPGVFRFGLETPFHPFARRRLLAGTDVQGAEGLQRIGLARIAAAARARTPPAPPPGSSAASRDSPVAPERRRIWDCLRLRSLSDFSAVAGVAFRERRAGRHQVRLGIGGLQLQAPPVTPRLIRRCGPSPGRCAPAGDAPRRIADSAVSPSLNAATASLNSIRAE